MISQEMSELMTSRAGSKETASAEPPMRNLRMANGVPQDIPGHPQLAQIEPIQPLDHQKMRK